MLVQRPFVVSRPSTSFDRAFAQLTRDLFAPVRRVPEVDASWRDGSLVLTVDLPGVAASSLEVQVADRVLTVGVAQGSEHELAGWQRNFRLGASLDPERVEARYVDGRLTVTVGELAAAAPRSIAIDTAPAVPAVEATSTESPAEGEGSAAEADTEG